MPKPKKPSNHPKEVIYKLIYPNVKIYVGSDLTDDIRYLESANLDIIEWDFAQKQRRCFKDTSHA